MKVLILVLNKPDKISDEWTTAALKVGLQFCEHAETIISTRNTISDIQSGEYYALLLFSWADGATWWTQTTDAH